MKSVYLNTGIWFYGFARLPYTDFSSKIKESVLTSVLAPETD